MSDAEELRRMYGTPIYRYDAAELRAAAAGLREAVPDYVRAFYSVKANPHPEVIRVLRDAGCRAEVSSPGELAAALQAGHRAPDCLYSGPGKTPEEIRNAVGCGVRRFSTESLTDLERVLAAGRAAGVDLDCLIRVNASSGTADTGIRMTGRPSQFGFDLGRTEHWAPAALELAGDRLCGLHFFPVSNARDEDGLAAEMEGSIATAVRLRDDYGMPLRWLDLGGGFAAPYAEPGHRPVYPKLRSRLDEALRRELDVEGPDAAVIVVESGRYLTATAGSLLTSVLDVKHSRGRTFVVADAGVNHLGGMSGLQRIMPLAARPDDGNAASATLVGPLCTPLDVLARDAPLGASAPGDLLTIPNVGAYGLSASLLAFLSRDLPAEVVVDGDRVTHASRQTMRRTRIEPAGATGDEDPREIARRLVPVLAEHARRVDAEAVFPVESVLALRRSGLMGLLVPRCYGGLGGDLRTLAEVTSTLAGGCCSTAMIFAMHCQQTDAVVRFANAALRARLLPRIAAGDHYLASITSERETGGHLLTSAEPLRHEGEALLVVRDAPVVTGGAHADGFLITMRASPEAPPSAVTLIHADRADLEISTGGSWDPLGMRGTHSAGLKLRGTVRADQVVGAPGAFRDVAVDSFMPVGHIGWAAAWLGTARHALAELVGVLRSPRRPSSVDLTSDLVAERLARARMALETVSAYLGQVIDEVSEHRGRASGLEVPAVQIHLDTLKVLAAEGAFEAVNRCVQLAGLGLGYLKGSPLGLERALRDLRSASLNYADDRLLKAIGTLQLADRSVNLIDHQGRSAIAWPDD
jgi:acyl-CoA dehydrogenase